MINKEKITPALIAEIKKKIESSESETSIRKYIRDNSGLGKSRTNEIFNEIKETLEEADKYGLEFITDGKVYNRDSDTYVLNLKSLPGKPLVISGSRHRALCRDYSSMGQNLSVQEICLKYKLTPQIFSEYKKIFSLVKEKEPLSEEEVMFNSIDKSVETILEQKRYSLYQEFEKEIWKETQLKARKWDEFQFNTLDTVGLFLEGWKPQVFSKVKSPKPDLKAKHTFLVGCNDWHISELYEKEKGFSGEDFNSSVAVKLIDKYADKIQNTIESRTYKFKEIIVVANGDLINSCYNGKTVKGTPLHNDKINEEMFEVALDTTIRFIERMACLAPKTSVIFIIGNHDGPLLSILGLAVQAYFKNVDSVNIHVSKSWAEIHRFGNIAALITHGGSAEYKTSLPPSSPKLKNYIQEMFLCHPKILSECKSKIVISGHYHRFWQQDMGHFDFYCFGGLPVGGHYEDEMNLRSTPRQNALIMDEDWVIETLHFYFS